MLRKIKIKKNHFLILLKLFHDWLLISLVLLFLMLVGEILLPGLVSRHVGFFPVVIFISCLIMIIRKTATYLDEKN